MFKSRQGNRRKTDEDDQLTPRRKYATHLAATASFPPRSVLTPVRNGECTGTFSRRSAVQPAGSRGRTP
eukprot:11914693-Ditylum_brightwellii.AAC.1